MGDKDEAEWLLEKFFQRLEESFRSGMKQKEEEIKRETAHDQPSTAAHQTENGLNVSSNETVTEHQGNGFPKRPG